MTIAIRNHTESRLIFSDFKAAAAGDPQDAGVPFDTKPIDAGATGTLETGSFSAVAVGAQVQAGGEWVVDPRTPGSRVLPGQHFTVALTTEATDS